MSTALAAVVAVVLSLNATVPAAVPAHLVEPARLAPCGPQVTDPLAEPPWPLIRLRPELAWPLSTGAGVTVAVIDSGVSADHPALAGKVLPGADYVLAGGGPGTCDENGHGTLIAGIVAGRETTSAGYRFHGVAPGADIVSVRVLRDQRRSFEADLSQRIATAIRFVVDQRGADVVNLSLTTLPTPELAAAVAYALSRRVVVVAAAGNEGGAARGNQPVYPAAYPGVLAVAGVDASDQHVTSSTSGDYVDVAAPGERIAGPSPAGGGYLFTAEGGTSFASGYVSGVAALIRAYEPDLDPAAVTARITSTADHPAELWNPDVGHGVVNPARAVGALAPARAQQPVGGQIRPRQPQADPLRGLTRTATLVTVVGGLLAVLVLLAVPVVRRGRQRGWRP